MHRKHWYPRHGRHTYPGPCTAIGYFTAGLTAGYLAAYLSNQEHRRTLAEHIAAARQRDQAP